MWLKKYFPELDSHSREIVIKANFIVSIITSMRIIGVIVDKVRNYHEGEEADNYMTTSELLTDLILAIVGFIIIFLYTVLTWRIKRFNKALNLAPEVAMIS